MKKIILTTSILLLAGPLFACDAMLRPFARDCRIQDRLARLSASYQSRRQNVNDVAEYRVMRFIDRYYWEQAKTNHTAPENIFQPAPTTWEVWNHGIHTLFDRNLKGALFGTVRLDNATLSRMNTVLLTDGTTSIKDPNTDQKKAPGEFRQAGDTGVGFCNPSNYDSDTLSTRSKQSMERLQQKWEQDVGATLQSIVQRARGPLPEQASMAAAPFVDRRYACNGTWVSYVPSEMVGANLSWIRTFLETNLGLFRQSKAVLAPIALAAVVQKWFVSVHPFSDGNGRTSRAVEDLILANFGLPYVPTGDLQDDAMAEAETYIENTYVRMEAMLGVLERCAAQPTEQRAFQCLSVTELNARY